MIVVYLMTFQEVKKDDSSINMKPNKDNLCKKILASKNIAFSSYICLCNISTENYISEIKYGNYR